MKTTNLLKLSVFLIFIGRAWQHIFWDAPFRTFFWNESLLKSFVEKYLNISWTNYVTSPQTDAFIQTCIQANGVLYAIAAFCAIIITKNNKKVVQKAINWNYERNGRNGRIQR